MIGYLEGKILKKDSERILLLVNQIGYEVQLPSIVMESLNGTPIGESIALFIYHHQTERQPKPVLIGFNNENEKDFFQLFLSVEAIGPMKAVKAMNIPLTDIANAIEIKDVNKLSNLKGIGKRTAQKIIASLEGKVSRYTLLDEITKTESPDTDRRELIEQVMDVLVAQLGHKPTEAKALIIKALEQNESIDTPEALLEEVYRSENP